MRLTGLERQMLESVYRRETPYVRQDNGEALAVDYAIEHCFVRDGGGAGTQARYRSIETRDRCGHGRGCYARVGQVVR